MPAICGPKYTPLGSTFAKSEIKKTMFSSQANGVTGKSENGVCVVNSSAPLHNGLI